MNFFFISIVTKNWIYDLAGVKSLYIRSMLISDSEPGINGNIFILIYMYLLSFCKSADIGTNSSELKHGV
jgi:hypothetical protein